MIPQLAALRAASGPLIVAAIAAAAFGSGWMLQGWRMAAHVERANTRVAQISQQHAERIAQAEAAGRAAVEADMNRQRELAERIAHDAQVAIAQIERERAAAVAAGRGLRDAARSAAARACGDPIAPAAPASGSASAPSAGDLLADVLGRLDEAGRELAAEADRRRAAGLACEAVSQ